MISAASNRPSQAALAILLLRAPRTRWHGHGQGLLEDDTVLGLELDDVLLGADPRPPLSEVETNWRRWVRAQKEQDARDRADQEAHEARVRAQEERKIVDFAKWAAAAEQAKVEAQARQEFLIAERVAQREAKKKEDLRRRVKKVAERWIVEGPQRAAFESLFSADLIREVHGLGSVFDLCTLCRRPYWIQYDNLINWDRYWQGPPRCYVCFCPPLVNRIRFENPTWTPMRVSNAVFMAMSGQGAYAYAPELLVSRQWWINHARDYREHWSDLG